MPRHSAAPVLLGLLVVATSAAATTRHVFVTSASGQGNLGAWPDAMAESATGLDAGDAICTAAAVAAGLSPPAVYRAWLSTSTTDAYCHIQGYDGKIATNCGQASLPTAAGPWKRVDDRRFAADLVHMLDPYFEVYLPPRLDENGNTVHDRVWTGTSQWGGHSSYSCADWTSTGSYATAGSSDDTGQKWTAWNATSSCSAVYHLLCFEMGTGDPLGLAANSGRLAFVTSAGGNGDLSTWPASGGQAGLGGGNAICRALAAAAGLSHATTFKAWLSNGSTNAVDRIVNDGPWIRLDRTRVGSDLADLTDGYLHAPINQTETGAYLPLAAAWTGTDASGLAVAHHCSNWDSALGSDAGRAGAVSAADGAWSDVGNSNSCDDDTSSIHLYCLQDFPLVFADDVESGNLDAWAAAGP